MDYFLIWIALSALAGYAANSKGHSGILFFFISLLLSPIVGIIWALLLKDESEEKSIKFGDLKKCPFCAEAVKYEAIKCKHCGELLSKSSDEKHNDDLNELIKKIKKE